MIKLVLKSFVFSVLVLGATIFSHATFHPGDRGEDVIMIQNRLVHLGYAVTVDGAYGPITEDAIKTFQETRGLEVNGLVDRDTYRLLVGRDIPVSRSDFSTSIIRRLVVAAQEYIGVPYYFGGTTPSGFDCSGFVQYVCRAVGIPLPRMADEQYMIGYEVAMVDLVPGDLVFFSTYEYGASHSGIYLGYGKFISATSSRGVAIDSLSDDYWQARYLGARRII